MIRLRTIKVKNFISGSRTPYRFYELYRKREMDGKWWYGWFTRPMQKLNRYLQSSDFVDHVLIGITILLVVMLLFCVTMLFLLVFNQPQHDQVIIAIEARIV